MFFLHISKVWGKDGPWLLDPGYSRNGAVQIRMCMRHLGNLWNYSYDSALYPIDSFLLIFNKKQQRIVESAMARLLFL